MRRLSQLLLFFTIAVCAGIAQSADDPTVKVEVKLVNVFTTVTDANGAPVAGLKKEDFQILEDGVPQTTAIFARQSDLPLSIVLAIDSSLSTRDDLKFELRSARGFAHDVVDPLHHDALALYQFERDVKELVPFTSSLSRIDAGI